MATDLYKDLGVSKSAGADEIKKVYKKLAAQLLGVHRRTLYRLTKRYGISLSERDHHHA